MAVVCFMDFELGYVLDQADSQAGNVSVQAAAGLGESNYGLRCVSGNGNYVQYNLLDGAVDDIRWRFYIDTSVATGSNGASVEVLAFYNASNVQVGRVVVGYSSGYYVRYDVKDDAGVYQQTSQISISNGEHCIDGELQRASSSSANDGEFTLWVDRDTSATATGLDLYNYGKATYVRLGSIAVSGTIGGYVYVDELLIQSDLNPIFQKVPAFPGAYGAGWDSRGGRGGTVYHVTNTNSSGGGSLRAAIEASGPRMVVFDVGGTIDIGSNILKIRDPYITILGQTAPGGDGICIKGILDIQTHDVIVRYVRCRADTDSEANPDDIDAFHIFNQGTEAKRLAHHIIIDHCSFSWGVDSVADIGGDIGAIKYDLRSITIQHCFITEGLANANHSEGLHSTGQLIEQYSKTVTIYKCLYAQNRARNPWIRTERADFINNVIYNSRTHTMVNQPPVGLNYIGVTHVIGFWGANQNYRTVSVNSVDPSDTTVQIYVDDCYGNFNQTSGVDWDIVGDDYTTPATTNWQKATPHPYLGAAPPIEARATAYQNVLDYSGCYAPGRIDRDSADSRVVSDVENETGDYIDYPTDVGGWPSLATGSAATDSDNDGMPDSWESANGLSNSVDDSADLDLHSYYTNLEMYSFSLSGDDPGEGGGSGVITVTVTVVPVVVVVATY